MQAIWNNIVIAESDDTIVIEGNHYFPPASVNMDFFKRTDLTTDCFRKGTATYFTLEKDDKKDQNAALDYQKPLESGMKKVGKDFSNYIAFYPQVVNIQ